MAATDTGNTTTTTTTVPVNGWTLTAVGLSCLWSGALSGVAAGLVIGGVVGLLKKK